MSDSDAPTLDSILGLCAAATPDPWYPSAYSKTSGVARAQLDPLLDELRMAGLIRLTDWVPEYGQGYVLTLAGEQIAKSPRKLARLRKGKLPARGPVELTASPASDREITSWDRGEAIRSALLFPAPPRVAMALLTLNVLWFGIGFGLAMQHGVAGDYLWGFSDNPAYLNVMSKLGILDVFELQQGQWWRLLSCCFVHIGLLHLGFNMYLLFAVGGMVEAMWGHVRFLVLYALAGFAGSCGMAASAWGHGRGGGGASGALWGIMVGQAAWILLNRQFLPAPQVRTWMRQLGICFIINFGISMAPGISASAHFGGGAAGLVAAVLLNHHRVTSGWQRIPSLLGLVFLPLVCVLLLLRFPAIDRPEPGAIRADVPLDEFRAFTEHHVPRAKQVEQSAMEFFHTRAEPLLKQPPPERDAAEKKRVVAGLERDEGGLRQTAENLEKAGPYRMTKLEGARRTRRRLLAEEAKLLAEATRCLREDSDYADDRLVQQLREVKSYEAKWRDQLQGLGQ